MSDKPLTGKQKKFAEAYVICLNATEAARQAGYTGSDRALAVTGWHNLRKANILAYIHQLMGETAMQAQEVLGRLSAQARADMGDFIDPRTMALDWNGVRAAGLTHLIKKYKQTTTTTDEKETLHIEIELYDAQAALVHLGKVYALFTDKLQIDDTFKLKALDLIRSGEIDKETFSQDFSESLADELFRLAGVSTSTTP